MPASQVCDSTFPEIQKSQIQKSQIQQSCKFTAISDICQDLFLFAALKIVEES